MIRTPELSSCPPRASEILTPAALEFVAELVRTFRHRVAELHVRRAEVQAQLDEGIRLDFDPATLPIRQGDWTVASLPEDLCSRQVEITGPVERKMIINALNSGANVFMADFEDSSCPTWDNIITGQINLRDAVAGTIGFDHPVTGKVYRLEDEVATLMVRPRGWHLTEAHLHVDGAPAPAPLVDFGLYFFHNALALVERGSGPYFYLPKLEHHTEAVLWNDIFVRAQRMVGLPLGSIKATVLIETLPAAFQMHEILYALREHSAGLNCGRWDYIFSFIKKHRSDPGAVLPDRSQVGMDQPFMRAYTQLLIQTCHRRGVHAIGGMAAQIPIKHDEHANTLALDKVRADKLREVQDGHDGTWVAHPGLVPLAAEVFQAHMTGDHQLHRLREDVRVEATDLLSPPAGTRTEAGLRNNIRVGVQYLTAWLGGTGCVPLNHLMEDAATAEISRTQVWQWRAHGATLEDGRIISGTLIESVLSEELSRIAEESDLDQGTATRLVAAGKLFSSLCLDDDLTEFLTLPAYEWVRLPNLHLLPNPQH